jgi:hypothetical protein
MAYGCEEERFSLPIEAVDTHRPKPNRRNSVDGPAPAPEEAAAGTARDYFGDSAPEANKHVDTTEVFQEATVDQAEKEQDAPEQEPSKMATEKARQNILLQHAEEQGKKVSEVTQDEASISQADIARALQAQSAIGSRRTKQLTRYSDLPKESAENALCAPPMTAGSVTKSNRHKIHCPRKECGSLILSTGTANWVVEEGGKVGVGGNVHVVVAVNTDPYPSTATV